MLCHFCAGLRQPIVQRRIEPMVSGWRLQFARSCRTRRHQGTAATCQNGVGEGCGVRGPFCSCVRPSVPRLSPVKRGNAARCLPLEIVPNRARCRVRLSSARMPCQQPRLPIPSGDATLGCGPRVFLKLEQSRLISAHVFPRLQQLAAEFAERPPAKGMSVDNKSVGRLHAARSSASASCMRCRKSAARWAWAAALKMARLSPFSTSNHDAI